MRAAGVIDGTLAREALLSQGRILLALMLREARTRYGRRQLGYIWALIEPIIHISMFAGIYYYASRGAPLGDNIVTFLATGLAVFLGFRNTMSRTQGGYSSNEALLSFPIVKVLDVFVGRAILELATWVLVMLIIFGSLLAFGYAAPPRDVLILMSAIGLLFLLGFGCGMSIGLISEFFPSVGSLLSVPQRLLYFTSGVFYLPDTMLLAMRDIIGWNPVLHGITLFRTGYYHYYDSQMLDVAYLAEWAVGSTVFALALERVLRKPLRARKI
jgi:capsular polysaccharide transport system permease protein